MITSFSAHIEGKEEIIVQIGTNGHCYILVEDGKGASFAMHFPSHKAMLNFMDRLALAADVETREYDVVEGVTY